MKSTAPLILSFFLCTLCYAQQKHISDFTSVDPGIQDTNFNIPFSHTFQYLIGKGDPLDSGGTMPDNLDFTGYVPKEGSSKSGYLSVNSELIPKGAVTILDIEFDDVSGKWIVDNSQAVDFSFSLPAEQLEDGNGNNLGIGSTVANCSGTVTPWNTIITCEEWTNKDVLNKFPDIDESLIKVDGEPGGYNAYGWAIEINPATKTIVNRDTTRIGHDKLWAMGNFKHENAVIHSNLRTVYQGADDTKGEGYLFKFVADQGGNLYSGKLYVFRKINESTGEWILLDNSSISERNSTLEQCAEVGATNFDGIEDVEISPVDGMVYFAVKGDGKVYRFTDIDPVSGATVNNFDTYVGGMSYQVKPGVNEAWGTGNDNLLFDSLGNLWVAQDGSFREGDNNYIWVVENGHTQANPKVKIFARTPQNSEPTGLTFSPDERYIFMSIQHPSGNDSDQTDVFGTPVSFNDDIVLVLARNEFLGKDEIMITQYYHEAESKWIEIKNISGNDIPEGKYSINRYDASGGDVVSEIIPALTKDEVLLFKNSANPAQPNSNFIGDVDQIESDVCDFNGDDMILITTSSGGGKHINRKDILGYKTPSSWGDNKALIRGGNSLELPEKDFDPNNWIEPDSLQEVSLADKNKNIALGTHVTGPTKWNGTSWDRLEPDRTRITEINGEFVGGQEDFAAYDLTISETGSLNFEDNTDGINMNVIVYRNLTIDPNGSFIIGDTESLIIKNTSATVTGSIEKIEKSTTRNHVNDITYWSSPVQDEQIEKVFDKVNPERIFYYDQSRYVSDDTYWDVWANQSTGPMIVGKGYAAEGPANETGIHDISFKGSPNFGTIEISDIVFNNDEGNNENSDNDYNLIGNPYPAAIDIEVFLKTNTETNKVIDGTVYLWTHDRPLTDGAYENDYITHNFMGATGRVKPNIGSGQGFFIRAIDEGNVVFNNSMILAGSNDQFFKGLKQKNNIEKNRVWLNLKGSDKYFKQILIGFDKNATDGMDPGYDALYLKGNQPIAFYSLLDNKELSIQGFGSFDEEKVIKIGFNAELEGLEMTLEVDREEGLLQEQDLLLFDKENGILHDLNTSSYTFKYNGKGTFQERFDLLFSSAVLGLDEGNLAEDVKVYIKDQYLIIEAQHLIEQIKVYDALGRLVRREKSQSTYSELNLDRIKMGSFFIVELVDGEGKTLTRKMIKY